MSVYQEITPSLDELATHWQEQIKHGKTYRKKFSSYKQWKDYRKMYRGDWAEGVLPVNRIFSFGRSLLPQVYFRAPYVTVTALRPEFVPHARVLEQVDNWLIQECLLKQTLKSSCLESYICGTGPIKLGFDSEFGYIPPQAVDIDGGTATQFARQEERLIEYNVNVKPGMPWALPFYAEDLIVPYGYKYLSSLPWIGHRIIRPLRDVRQDQKYSNTKELKGTRMSELEDTKNWRSFYEGQNVEYCELYEIRDASERRIITLCENQIIMNEYDELQTEGLPYDMVIFNEDPEHFFGISDVKILEPQQLELNDIRSQQSEHRKISLLKFLAQKGVFKKEEVDAFLSGDGPGVFVEVDAEQLANAIMQLQPHVPPELGPLAQQAMQDMRESAGFSENQLGAFSPYHGKTATETMEVASSNDNRVNERKDIVADVITRIIRKWNQFIFKFWTQERVIRVAGPDGAQGWVSYTGDMLRGEYAVRIDPESGFPVSKAMRAQLADGLLKTYGGDMLINQPSLRMQHLQQFEWIFPGITSSLIPVDPRTGQVLAQQRQPNPMGGSTVGSGGQRGGGREAGSTQNVTPFEKYKKSEGKE